MQTKEELKKFYQENMYGSWRTDEQVSYELGEDNQVKIIVEKGGARVDFTVKLQLPTVEAGETFGGKCPFIICMHPIAAMDYALSQGYASIVLDTYQIASDDDKHRGCFYELYPYGATGEEQTGVLMAWAWGASKVLDAVHAGLGEAVGLDVNASIVTGVSRWGKATAVCGAFDERFAMTVPACSGAGGLALYSFLSQGKTYNFESVGGPARYTYGQNEPLSCLQSEAERGWFNDKFLEYQSPEEIPVEQYMLPVMAADKNRFYFIIGAYTGEDWVNSPAMWECYKQANELYVQMGLEEHLVVHFHKEGHAVIEEDLRLLIPYFNYKHYGMEASVEMATLKTAIFDDCEI